MKRTDTLYLKMISYDAGCAERIQHFTKVHSFARIIGLSEGLDERTLELLEAAAYVHDIGIKKSEEIYNRSDGALQAKLGPPEAERLLHEVGYNITDIERITYLVAHHHTYTGISGIDYQILVEADFLVNLYEHGNNLDEAASIRKIIFKTESGTKLFDSMYQL